MNTGPVIYETHLRTRVAAQGRLDYDPWDGLQRACGTPIKGRWDDDTWDYVDVEEAVRTEHPGRGLRYVQPSITDELAAVTCQRCLRSDEYRERKALETVCPRCWLSHPGDDCSG